MWLFQNETLKNYSDDFKSRINGIVTDEIRSRVLVTSWVPLALFCAGAYSTLFSRRFPTESLFIGIALLVLFVIQFILASFGSASVFYWITVMTSFAVWGGFSSWILALFALSWTSFLIMLMTLALLVGQLMIFSAHRALLAAVIALLGAPSLLVCLFVVGGQSGSALGLFLALYLGFVWLIGVDQNKRFWKSLLVHSRLEAIVDALPGSLAWFSSNMNYLGANERHLRTWELKGPIADRKLGDEATSEFRSFVGEVFKTTGELSAIKKVGRKTQYLLGKQYSYGGEALVMGIDVTSQHLFQDALEVERLHLGSGARALVIGRIVQELAAAGVGSQETAIYFESLALGAGSPRTKFLSTDFMAQVEALFRPICRSAGIGLRVDAVVEFQIETARSEMLLIVSELLINSIEALRNVSEDGSKEIVFAVKSRRHDAVFSVWDSGAKIDEALREIIFQPFFSTNESRPGMGLSLIAEVAEGLGGVIELTAAKEFQVQLPLTRSGVLLKNE